MNSTSNPTASPESNGFPSKPLWYMFDSAVTYVAGQPAETMCFTPGKTPMATFWETCTVLASYYAIVFGGRELMRNQPALKLNGLFKAHNLFLTILSGGLLALFVEQMAPTISRGGLYNSICGAGGWTSPLVTLYFLNYITKYIELIDTVFLVVKKKPLTFLHTYHHGATALLCYTQLVGHTPVSWVPITLNLFVHVVMYWYYYQSARGIRVPWKEWITRLQIIQFVLDLGFVYFATYDYAASTYFPSLPHVGKCQGEEFAALAGCAILSSYLVLFLSFYAATYKKTDPKPKVAEKQTNVSSEMAKEAAVAETAAEEMRYAEVPDAVQLTEKTKEGFDVAAAKAEKGVIETAASILTFPSSEEAVTLRN